ncbi:hypothetical protein EPUL_004080 [Erysiphe pulchra]|uniref:MARVEL domain-containing protein n=1 Tax=Erysiphe pulchra TaxID=225359 RepID=A0A2S4PSM7_9PEZI|nr:hypothetical protein EPUL_004080 [Erysiphe pulchra]
MKTTDKKIQVDEWTVMHTLIPKHAASPVGFLIFTPVISILSTTFLTLAPCILSRPMNRFLPAIFGVVNSIFYLSGFIALSVYLSNLNYCRGTVCDAAKAANFFAVASFSVWFAETAILGLAIIRGQKMNSISIKDDYDDHDDHDDNDDHDEEDRSDRFQRKHIAAGEKLSDVKL